MSTINPNEFACKMGTNILHILLLPNSNLEHIWVPSTGDKNLCEITPTGDKKGKRKANV